MNVAVVFAGGVGSRMQASAVPKQFLEISGRPILIHTLEHFERHPDIDAIAVAIVSGYRDHLERLLKRYEITKVKWVVEGGETGFASRHRALAAVAQDCPPDTVVLLHDGVRPLITAELISDNIESVRAHGSAITCSSVYDTLVSSADIAIDSVTPRDHVYAVQAPQSFRLGGILPLYDRAAADPAFDQSYDSCTLFHLYGGTPYRVAGPRSNIKITTAEDFYVCRAFFELIENRQIAGL